MTPEVKQLMKTAQTLLDWMPTYSEGSAGHTRVENLKAAIAGVAQSAEHLICNQGVASSSLAPGSTILCDNPKTHMMTQPLFISTDPARVRWSLHVEPSPFDHLPEGSH